MACTVPEVAKFSKEYVDQCVTHLKILKFDFSWTIHSFRDFVDDGGNVYSTQFPSESTSEYRWRLNVGSMKKNNELTSWLGITLDESPSATNFFKPKVVVKSNSGIEITGKMMWDASYSCQKGVCYKLLDFDPTDKLFKSIQENIVIISCTIEIKTGVDTEAESSMLKELHGLGSNMASLLDEAKYGDCTIQVGDQKFLVYKGILAARSSVFAEMFNSSENVQGPVTITDMDAAVFKELITFIYTNKVKNLDKFAYELFAAADKYKLRNLILLCLQSILANLSVKNAAKTLLLADTHGVTQLKIRVVRFLSSVPSAELDDNEDWKKLTETHSQLVIEAYRLVLAKMATGTNTSAPSSSNNLPTGSNISGPVNNVQMGPRMGFSNSVQAVTITSGTSYNLPMGSNFVSNFSRPFNPNHY